MALLALDLSVIQGEDKTFGPFVFATQDPSGLNNLAAQVYYNFTGAAARMQVRLNQDSGSALIFNLTSAGGTIVFSKQRSPGGPVAPATYNAFAATVAKALSLAVSPGTYYYDLFIDWAGGTSQEFLAGLFVVESSVSR